MSKSQLNVNMKVALQSVSYLSSSAKHGNFYLWRAESVFRMMRVSASKFGGDKRDKIFDKLAIHPEGGRGARTVCMKCQCNQSRY